MKQVVIVHRWDGSPQADWYQSVKEDLESKGYRVSIPQMPNPSEPIIDAWVSKLQEVVDKPTKDIYFIGHSIGCQTILRYLETITKPVHVGKVIFVAPWFHLQNVGGSASEAIARPWIETPLNFKKIKNRLSSIIAIFSDNDCWVPLSEKEVFKHILGAKVIVEHNKGHYTQDDNVAQLPVVVKEILD